MFPYLLPLSDDAPEPEQLGPLMTQGSLYDTPNPDIFAGFTYFGQFLDHDLTFDPTSSLEQLNDPDALENFRTPAFELDSLYGSGPAVSPHLYDRSQPAKFLLDNRRNFDLPRNSQETALLSDPRNDQSLIIAQLHLAFLKFHNAIVDAIKKKDPQTDDGIQDAGLFEKAQRLVRWHYQWIILHEYLPKIVNPCVIRDVWRRREFYQWEKFSDYPFIPVEFSVAAFRFGHSQIRDIYRINDVVNRVLFFDTKNPQNKKRHDLRGGKITADYEINWKNFFDTGGKAIGDTRFSRLIDTDLSWPLGDLPAAVIPNPGAKPPPLRNLAVLDLQRGQSMGLPSGQDVARRMGFRPLPDNELWNSPQRGLQIFAGQPAPLWYYILKEAEIQHGGRKLGEVGGRLVAEVFIGLLQADSEFVLNKAPNWHPVLQGQAKADFTIVDLLSFAGVKTT
jgi:hypothetical protein